MSESARDAEDAVARLRSLEDGPRAFFAVWALGATAVPALSALLSGPTESVDQPRRLAAEGLAAIGGPASADALLSALQDSAARHSRLPPVLREAEAGVLTSIASALANLRDHRAPDALSAILVNRCHSGCLAALASFRDPRAVGFAARCLRDGAASDQAAEVLRLYGLTSVPALTGTLASPRIVHGAEPPTSAAGRALAATLLGELAGREAERPLVAALGDESPGVRLAASLALARLGPDLASRAAPELARVLGDDDPLRAHEAEDALARLVPSPHEVLSSLLADPAVDTAGSRGRRRAIAVLGRLAPGEAGPVLADLALNADPEVRFAVTTALAHMGGEAAEAALAKLADDTDDDVRRRARAALAGAPALRTVRASGPRRRTVAPSRS